MDLAMFAGISLLVVFVYFAVDYHRSTAKDHAEFLEYLYRLTETINDDRRKRERLDIDVLMGRPPRKPFIRQLPLPGFERPGTWEEALVDQRIVKSMGVPPVKLGKGVDGKWSSSS